MTLSRIISRLKVYGARLRSPHSDEISSASVPLGARIYAIGDIHGRRDLLDQLLDQITDDANSTNLKKIIIFLGDYVDRGENSRGVIDRLLHGFPGFETHFLKGNHEEALLSFLSDENYYPIWRGFGGRNTLRSYGVNRACLEGGEDWRNIQSEFVRNLPPAHADFFGMLESSWAIGDYFFAHAGVRPGKPLDEQDEKDLLWIRDEFLFSRSNFGKVVVHGHTPSIDPVICSNRIGIDTGAYATGLLTALVLEGAERRFLMTSMKSANMKRESGPI